MTTLTRMRRRELELLARLAAAECRWIRRGNRSAAMGYDAAQRRLEGLRREIASLLPPVEYELVDGRPYLVLRRPTGGGPTGQCPLCGEHHWHSAGDGHVAAHCCLEGVEVAAPDGTVLRGDRGYIVRTCR